MADAAQTFVDEGSSEAFKYGSSRAASSLCQQRPGTLAPLLVGQSRHMTHVARHIRRVAPTSATVLISGESGTGKEVVARSIHALSERRLGPFIAVNCGALSAGLVESELFGHERGSFTGAERPHRGCFERAAGGTLLLDEVTEMSPALQVKLLEVLESGRYGRLGSETPRRTDARIIAATNLDPDEAVRAGRLRADLLYRLQVFPIHIVPLRDRPEDIRPLAHHFLERLNEAHGTGKRFAGSAIARLRAHTWPGNARELRNVVHRAFIVVERIIQAPDLPPLRAECRPDGPHFAIPLGRPLAEIEREAIERTLQYVGGSRRRCAAVLRISDKTLHNRLAVYRRQPQGGTRVPTSTSEDHS